METWQKKHLITNRARLVQETICNELIFAHLVSQGILARVDVERIKRSSDRYEQAVALYDLVETRQNGFVEMARALAKVQQTGPLDVFMNGFARNVTPSIKVDFFEKSLPLSDYFDASEVDKIIDKMKIDFTLEQYVNLYDKSKNGIKLLSNVIPKQISYYVSRSMSRRVKVNPALFKVNCPDVFVFKGIAYSKLKNLVNPHPVEVSSTQLLSLSTRFIILEHSDDWEEICKTAKLPVHLIKYEEERNEKILEATTGDSIVIHQYLERQKTSGKHVETVSFSEEEFFEEVSRDGSSGVCICDLPGMGKSLLLANFARRMKQQHPDKLVVFIQLSHFMSFVVAKKNKQPRVKVDPNFSNQSLLEYITPSHWECFLLTELINKTTTHLELFLDGFDEIQEGHVETARTLLSLLASLPSTRIFVTSRPSMRHEMEASLHVISYDILPFSRANQINFLTRFWRKLKPASSEMKLKEFAQFCIQELKKNLDENVDRITGIPLQCQLVAEVFSRAAIIFAHPQRNVVASELCQTEGSLYDLYCKYFELRFRKIVSTVERVDAPNKLFLRGAENAAEMMEGVIGEKGCVSKVQEITVFHMLQAVKLLFPETSEMLDQLYGSITENVQLSKVLSVGILQRLPSNGQESLQFTHRTFAEYLAASCFAKLLHDDETEKKKPKELIRFLFEEVMRPYYWNCWVYPVVMYFFNCACVKKRINTKNELLLKTCASSVGWHKLYSILAVCIRQNHVNLFLMFNKMLLKMNRACLKSDQKKMNSTKFYNFQSLDALLKVAVIDRNLFFIEHLFILFTERFRIPMDVWSNRVLTVIRYVHHSFDLNDQEYMPSWFPDNSREIFLLAECIKKTQRMTSKDLENLLTNLNWLLGKNENLIQQGHYALLYAHGVHVDVIKLLLGKGVDSRKTHVNETLVHVAARSMTDDNFAELFQTLSNDFGATDQFEKVEGKWNSPMPIILANRGISERTVEMIYEFSWLDSNSNNDTGAKKTRQRINVNINSYDMFGRTVLMCAADGQRSVHIITKMVEMGADVSAQDDRGNTFAHYIGHGRYSPEEYHAFVQLLIWKRMGKAFQMVNKKGDTPLHEAVRNLELLPKTLNLLVGLAQNCEPKESDDSMCNCYVDLNAVNGLGNSILYEAVINGGSLDLVKHLVEIGADWSIKNAHKKNLGHVSATLGRLDFLEYFVQLGCDVNELDMDGNNALQCAIQGSRRESLLEVVKFLLAHGVQKENKNELGKNAYMQLEMQNYAEDETILKLLKDEQCEPHD